MQPIGTSIEDTWLTLPKYQFWLDAIKSDDVQGVRLILESSDYLTRSKLLNGRFKITAIRSDILLTTNRHPIVRPLLLAVIHGSLGVCDVMIQYEADIFFQEANNDNMIHCLASCAFNQPKQEQAVVRTYEKLCQMLSDESTVKLLHMENEIGLRPLEFAAHLGTLEFMMALWETPRVYIVRQDVVGVFLYKWYDITEYITLKSDTARHLMKNPLQFMIHLDRRPFYSDTGRRVLSESIIADWIGRLVRSKIPTFLAWFVLKLIYICTFSIYQVFLSRTLIPYRGEDPGDLSDFNRSTVDCESYSHDWFSGGLKIFLEAYLIFHSTMICLYYISGFIVSSENRKLSTALSKDERERKKVKVFNNFSIVHQYVNALQALMVLMEIIILDHPTRQNALFLTISHVTQTNIILNSVVQCLMAFDTVGHVVVYIQRMISTASLFFGTTTIFTLAFGRLFVLMSARGYSGCFEEFSSFVSTIYSTALIFWNVVDLRRLEVEYPLGMYCAHVAFVFIVAVLIYNLQIAMFSDNVKEVYDNKSVIISINQMWAVGEIDFMFTNIPILSKFYRSRNNVRIRDSFVCAADRVYLVSRVSARKDLRQIKVASA